MKSVDQQIKDAMAKKVVGRTTEIYHIPSILVVTA
jgi:hypothetical protein